MDFGGIHTFQSNLSMIDGDLWHLSWIVAPILDKHLLMTFAHISQSYLCLPAYT